jgi:hypothetical protein
MIVLINGLETSHKEGKRRSDGSFRIVTLVGGTITVCIKKSTSFWEALEESAIVAAVFGSPGSLSLRIR